MPSHDVIFEVSEGIAVLTFNRPREMNALNSAIVDGIESALDELDSSINIKVLVITGKGRAFCAGADLKEVLAGADLEQGGPDFLDRLCAALDRLRALPVPVIAALNGITMAGGLETAMCADIVVASESARIGDAHANYGVYPGAGGAAILPRLVPLNIAKYLLFTGKSLSASEMMGYGFVNEVVEDVHLMGRTLELAAEVATKSPIALSRMKRVANLAGDTTRELALEAEQVELRRHMRSYDMKEGLIAFSEKRKPEFKGY